MNSNDLLSSAGNFGQLRTWLTSNRSLRELLKRHGLRQLRRKEWSAEQQEAALLAIDALPKAIRRSRWIRQQGKAPPADKGLRQGQVRIDQAVRCIDALLRQPRAEQVRLSGTRREDLLHYINGARPPSTWRDLVRLIDSPRLATRLAAHSHYNLADALVLLRPRGLYEELEWLLESGRFRGRFRLTPDRSQGLVDLRAALLQLPRNPRAGRPYAASTPLIRAGVFAWTAFGLPDTLSYDSATDRLQGLITNFVRDLIVEAGLPQPTGAALSQHIRELLRSL